VLQILDATEHLSIAPDAVRQSFLIVVLRRIGSSFSCLLPVSLFFDSSSRAGTGSDAEARVGNPTVETTNDLKRALREANCWQGLYLKGKMQHQHGIQEDGFIESRTRICGGFTLSYFFEISIVWQIQSTGMPVFYALVSCPEAPSEDVTSQLSCLVPASAAGCRPSS
jgi:hypothetical protein